MIDLSRSSRRITEPRALAVLGALAVLLLSVLAWRRRADDGGTKDGELHLTTRTSRSGDVDSDDPAGGWADDGGGGHGGSQTPTIRS